MDKKIVNAKIVTVGYAKYLYNKWDACNWQLYIYI